MRKILLILIVSVMGLIGICFAFIPFAGSLFPGANTVDPGFLVIPINELEPNKASVYRYGKYPILVLSYIESESNVSVSAFIGLPRFSDPMIKGCGVRPVDEFKNRNDMAPNAMFFEPCRGVVYDRRGEVLAGSHPSALMLMPVSVKIKEKKVYIGKFT